ncbi:MULTISPECIES: biopolymer transporter ExbD [unclassified Shewanella]|uniref:ExbD/TolR family protein n=1 Tax=unclassified Shewanella TaxID=196818 RepID=UPI001BB882F5|nr:MULTISPECIES: biopolymer transporter ExbD [unclassified Shewanella]GIU05365.1 biopolymer transporter protein ExbD [Shewanella sp. MBTL60-112-B1]GIU24073.1 biopolymer transporter protein ExbD [Shewanella sp. MBTL60-112-B2]
MINAGNDESSQSFGLDLTPLIDIIFIVLVFLLLTANTQLLSLPVDVPTEADSNLSALSQDKHIAINVLQSEPHWALDGQSFSDFDAFEAAFTQAFKANPKAKVIIAADKTAPVQPLMTLLAALQRQNITNTQILMEP